LNDSSFFYALWRRKQRYALKLLAAGANPNQADDCGYTPLMVAVSCCLPKMVQELIRRGADPNVQDKDGRTALRMACGHLTGREGAEIVHLLLEAGADITIPDKRGFTTVDTLLTLALEGVDLPDSVTVDKSLFNFLSACKSGDLRYLESVDCNIIPRRILNHALVDCSIHGFTDCCVLLISKGADPNGYNIAGSYPLERAIRYLHFNTAHQLIDYGALVNGPSTLDDNSLANTPLVTACQHEAMFKDSRHKRIISRMVTLLLHKGAAPNAKQGGGFTALRQAVLCSRDLSLIRKLLMYGADPSIKDDAGLSPLEHAQWTSRQDIVDLLQRHLNSLDTCSQ